MRLSNLWRILGLFGRLPKGRYRRLLRSGLLLIPLAGVAATVNDDAGRLVVLSTPAARIVSLAPHITELLFAAGAGPKVVGTVSYADYPEAARAIPRIGRYDHLDLERLVALDPDLVIAWGSGNAPGQIARLRELGLPVFVSEPRELDDIASSLERFGQLAGTEGQAAAAAQAFRQRLARLRSRYGGGRRPSVFYVIWNRPLMTVNGDHLISKVIDLCGGTNVFAHLPTLAPQVGLEAVIAADPEVIIASGSGPERPRWLDGWKKWTDIRAVRSGNLFHIPPDLIQRHTPRILEGAELMCGYLAQARSKGQPTSLSP